MAGSAAARSGGSFDWTYPALRVAAALGAVGADRLAGNVAVIVVLLGVLLVSILLGLGWIQGLLPP